MVVGRKEAAPEEPLLPAVARGDAEAVQQLITKYGGLVWSLARRFDPIDAEDAVQEIFVQLWKHAGRFDAAIASEATFIAMIARRRLIDRKRQRERAPQTSELAAPEPVATDTSPAISTEAALDELRPEQREVFLLATCYGLTHAEISERTRLPLGTVKAHVRRGLFAARHAVFGRKPPP